MNIGLLLTPVGVAFVCARASAIAFLCLCAVFAILFVSWNVSATVHGTINNLSRKLHREAKRRLGDDAAAGGRSAEAEQLGGKHVSSSSLAS